MCMKKLIVIILSIVTTIVSVSLNAQSYDVNNNQQQININLPVIEKPVYIEKYRTVYIEKPRVAKKLSEPVLLLGYIWVYPEDLGSFNQIPVGVINSINARKPYGRDTWRIPTPDELAVLEANADKIGLGDDIYLATDHRNGTLRLVAIEGEYANCVKIGNTYWMKTNLGAHTDREVGSKVSYEDAVKYCPQGFRLPTQQEYEELIALGEAQFEGFNRSNHALLYFPAITSEHNWNFKKQECKAYYWIDTNHMLYWYCGPDYYGSRWYINDPKVSTDCPSRGLVRYVLDK